MSHDNYIPVVPLQMLQPASINGSYILILDAVGSEKQIPVLIGESEAQALILASEQRQTLRPLTHALMHNIMQTYQVDVRQVTIDRFNEGIFYSTLHLDNGVEEQQIDCRTSDAIILALMEPCTILINPQVLEETGMIPGALTDNMSQPARNPESIEELEERLHECEENEDYEQAAMIQRQIDNLLNQ